MSNGILLGLIANLAKGLAEYVNSLPGSANPDDIAALREAALLLGKNAPDNIAEALLAETDE